MSNETNTPKQQNTKKPDYVLNHVDRREHGPDKWTQLGDAWGNDKGYINIKSPVLGDLVLQPREELERLRSAKKQTAETLDQSQTHKP